MANWKEMLIEVFKETGDDFEKMETTLTDEELVNNTVFDHPSYRGVDYEVKKKL